MPGFDGTGPLGQGPMTGGGRGFCALPFSGTIPLPLGRRFFGRGGGRGWRNWYYATGLPGWARTAYGYPAFGGSWAYPFGTQITPGQEKEMLKEQGDFLKAQLEDIQNRIATLEKVQEEKRGE